MTRIENENGIYLETERLILKPLCQNDFEAIYKLRSCPSVMKHMGRPKSKSAVEQFMEKALPYQEKHGLGFSSIFLKEGDSFIGQGVPDKDPNLFCQLLLSRSIYQYQLMEKSHGTILFDRGIPDCVAYANYFDLNNGPFINAANTYRYNPKVFFFPAWQEIYVNDEERKLSFDESREFGEKLKNFYLSLNYQIIEVPKCSPIDRASFIMEHMHA